MLFIHLKNLYLFVDKNKKHYFWLTARKLKKLAATKIRKKFRHFEFKFWFVRRRTMQIKL